MSELKNKNSYDNCMAQLQARYNGRGTAVNAAKEVSSRIAKENAPAPNAYLIARMNKSTVGDQYRNGEHNGQKYMTTGDFLKYYNQHKNSVSVYGAPKRAASSQTKEFARPKATMPESPVQNVKNSASVQQQRTVRPATATYNDKVRKISKIDPKADTIVMPARKTTNKIMNRIINLKDKWFPAEDKNEKTSTLKKSVPVAAIGLILSVAAAMTVIVSTTVMASDAQVKLSNVKYEIECLQAEKDHLEEELVKKDDLAMIKEYAENELGMIRQDYVSSVYMEIGEEDSVNGSESFDGDMSAILAAIGGK